jgi:hypothetical protein
LQLCHTEAFFLRNFFVSSIPCHLLPPALELPF